MKGAIRHILCAFVAVLYVASHIGCGIHFCHEERAAYLVPLIGDTSTEAIHEHHHDHHHDCPKSHTSSCKGCHGCDAFSEAEEDCETNVYAVTDAQDSDNRNMVVAPDSIVLFISSFSEATASNCCYSSVKNLAPPLIPGISLEQLSIWRL